MQKGLLFIVVGLAAAAVIALCLLAGCGKKAADNPAGTTGRTEKTASLSFSSFDGGGHEYTARLDDPSVAEVSSARDYGKQNHEEIDGAGYNMVFTFQGKKPGTTALTIVGTSPIMDREEYHYTLTVDDALRVTVTEQESPQTDALRPVPTLVIETEERQFYASVRESDAAQALVEKLSAEPITIELEDYGGFEKVGTLPWALPQSDEEITAQLGDILLYQGDKLCLYYDENTYAFTPLARIESVTREALLSALGDGSVSVRLYVEWSE